MSGEFIRDVIKNVGPRLRAEGFDTMFVTPDDVRSSNAAAKARIILADPVARQYVGALATHLYDESVSNVAQMQALAQQYQLPLWMTEFSTSGMPSAGRPGDAFAWASLMHDLISTYDMSAVDYMWGFFGEWDRAQLVTLNHTGSTYDGYTLNKVYYTTGQFSRFVEPGAERISASSSDATVQTTAFLDDDGDLVIVAINNGASNQQTTFNLGGITGFDAVGVVRTSASENWATLPAITVNGSAFSAVLPHNSITTFTADAPARVVRRHVFYNNSSADGRNPAANAADDAAIATDKTALLPGQTSTFANVTGYSRGINGVMIDLAGLPLNPALASGDFVLETRAGTSWVPLAAAPQVSVRPGAGESGTDRVTLTLPDGTARNSWLRVTVKATPSSGLASPDVFYFGNLVGDTGGPGSPIINAIDIARTRAQLGRSTAASLAIYDFNKDGMINAIDVVLVRSNHRRALALFTAPIATDGAATIERFSPGPMPALHIRTASHPSRRGVWDEPQPDLLM